MNNAPNRSPFSKNIAVSFGDKIKYQGIGGFPSLFSNVGSHGSRRMSQVVSDDMKIAAKVLDKKLTNRFLKNPHLLAPDLFGELSETEEDSDITISGMRFHDELHSDIWTAKQELHSSIRARLMKIVGDFIAKLEIPASKVRDITLTGSLANYNWSSHSDVDLHVLIDFNDIDIDKELLRTYFQAVSSNWNQTHGILIKNHPVEIYVQDMSEPHHSTGVYSVKRDKWLNSPSSDQPVIDKTGIRKKAIDTMLRIDRLKSAYDKKRYLHVNKQAEKLRDRIRSMRKAGLEAGGEYSVENLAFKVLRRNGYLKLLSNIRIDSYDKAMSLNGLNESVDTHTLRDYVRASIKLEASSKKKKKKKKASKKSSFDDVDEQSVAGSVAGYSLPLGMGRARTPEFYRTQAKFFGGAKPVYEI
jgi:hypothetical protein